MKKIYLLVIALMSLSFGYSQTTLVAIDRTNQLTPTTTGTANNISASGFKRGAGVSITGAVGQPQYKTRAWNATSLAGAEAANEYVEWSMTANADFSADITGLKIMLNKDANGPQNFILYFSLDGFLTKSSIGIEQTLIGIPGQSYNYSGMDIVSGFGGTVTFRLYAWNSLTNNGQLQIRQNTAWAANSISQPGCVLIGNVNYNGLIYASNAWTPSAPTALTGAVNALVVDGTYSINSDIAINNIKIESAAAVAIDKTGNLTVNGNLNNLGSFTLNSDSDEYSSLIINGTSTGSLKYNRHVNGQPGVGVGSGANDLISAPFSGQSFGTFASANVNLRANTNAGFETQRLFGPFSKTTGTYELWDVVGQGSNVLTAGVGYRAASTDNGGFTFTGTANNGVVTNNIVNSGPQFAAYNLVGNPYPSYINVREFLEYDVDPSASVVRNIDLMALQNMAIYGYDGDATGTGGDGWIVYNLTTLTSVNMAPGQGFFVTADGTQVSAYDMTFTPSMRRVGTTDDFIPGRLANENNAHLKIQAAIGNSTYKTDIFFNEASTSGLDLGYDASVFGSDAATKSIYTHLVENNTGIDMAIQSLAYSALGSDIVVPVGINATQGQQVTVSIAESDLPSNIYIYLEDTVTGTFTLLNTNDYVFTANAHLNSTGRFFLRFADQTLATPDTNMNQLQIYATAAPRALLVKGLLANTTSVQIYDVQGRLIISTQLEASSTTNHVDVSNLSSGVYVVKLNNKSQQKTQKIILK